MPAGWTGTAPGRRWAAPHPLEARRKNPLAPVVVVEDLAARRLRSREVITTRPAVLRQAAQAVRQPGAHARRPGCSAPLRNSVIAGAWLIASVCIDLTKHNSSATGPCAAGSRTARLRCGRDGGTGRAGQDQLALVLRHRRQALAICTDAAAAGRGGRRGPACSRTGQRATGRRLHQVNDAARPGGRNGQAGRPRRRRRGGSLPSRTARAAAPRPKVVRPKNCRRVSWTCCSRKGCTVGLLQGPEAL